MKIMLFLNRKINVTMMICFVIFATSIVSVFPNIAFGVDGGTTGTSNLTGGSTGSSGNTTATLQNPLKVKSIGEAINVGIEAFTYIAVIFAVLALIWVGFEFILSRGNPVKASAAKMKLTYVVVGIAIILGARLIVWIVLDTLTATGVLNTNVTTSAENALKGN